MNSFERGRGRLQVLVDEQANIPEKFDENEATTRLQLIDVILKDVLNWPIEEIHCEEYSNKEYLDYVLGSPEKRAILEAKRSGVHFIAPEGIESGILNLSTLYNHSSENLNAINQVLNYCQRAGVAVAFLSNGLQFIGFLGCRVDGIKPVEGKAIYYLSLKDILDDFNQFWSFFSYEGIKQDFLMRSFISKKREIPAPLPLSSRITSYPGYRIGSAMEVDLGILGGIFLQDLTSEDGISDDFLKECFCSSGALSQYATVSKEILRTRYALLDEEVKAESATTKHGANSHLAGDILGSALIKRPIVLLGDVGVGKSIFLKHFFRIDAKDILDKTMVFYVDFLKHSGLLDDVQSHIVKVISQTLETDYSISLTKAEFVRAVYNKEINNFKQGIYGYLESAQPEKYRDHELKMLETLIADSYEHTRRSLFFISGTTDHNFVIILDNVDQHLASFQDRIFVAGQSLADTWHVAVFMSLRPDTFNESRKSGVLAAYQPRVFTISPPRSDEVIIRRLNFAQKELAETGRFAGFPQGLTIDSKSLEIYIEVLIDAFTTNHKLIELVDNLSSGNTRLALDFISTFVGSGYVQTKRILDEAKAGNSYVIPLHEFLRAILFGDRKYYDPKVSRIPNLFLTFSDDPKEHFLLPMLLAFVQLLGDGQTGGFADTSTLYDHLQGLGYSGDQINAHFERAKISNLIESANTGDNANIVRITPAGGYSYKMLVSNFEYVDAVIVDTPILDTETRTQIRDVPDINQRIEREELFFKYLVKCWPFNEQPLPFSWAVVSAERAINLKRVKRGASRILQIPTQ